MTVRERNVSLDTNIGWGAVFNEGSSFRRNCGELEFRVIAVKKFAFFP